MVCDAHLPKGGRRLWEAERGTRAEIKKPTNRKKGEAMKSETEKHIVLVDTDYFFDGPESEADQETALGNDDPTMRSRVSTGESRI